MTAAELQALLYREIPLCTALQLQVLKAGPEHVSLQAPLEPNRNLHGTAFAGSQYCLGTLAGWSLASLYASAHGISGAVVLRHADVRYSRPVTASLLLASAELPAQEQRQAFLDEVARRGRGRLLLSIGIQENGRPALQMTAEYVVTRDEGGTHPS